MAQKKITDLDLRSDFDATVSIPVDDTTQTYRCTGAQVLAYVKNVVAKSSIELLNLAIDASVSANALTVAMKTQAAATPSSSDPVVIGFRNSTVTNGGFNVRTLEGAMSITVPSGATLGTSNGAAETLYLYALDNAGTIELGIYNGNELLDDGSVQSSTILNTSSDNANVLYSTTARSNVPVRLIGRIVITEATAGTWATAPTTVSIPPFEKPRIAPTVQTFLSSSGTYTLPTSPRKPLYLKVKMAGGGGGSKGGGGGSPGNGSAGGNSTFGSSLLVANGGSGATSTTPPNGGTASLGAAVGFALSGAKGNVPVQYGSVIFGGAGASTPFGGGAAGGYDAPANTGAGGGGGGSSNSSLTGGAGGAAAGYVEAIITNPASTYAYAVGAGGAGGTAGTTGDAGGSGAAGIIIVEEHYQ